MRTSIYVDGFNLYHSALEARPEYRWLDLLALARNALPAENEIVLVRYFTARVKGDENQGGPQRQEAYFRALKAHIDCLEVHWGNFVLRSKWRRLVEPAFGLRPQPGFVKVWQREEKGTDVSLAAHMLNDAWLDRYDCAVLISNDTDLCEALKLVRQRGKKVTLLSPANLAKKRENSNNEDDRSIPSSLSACVDHVRHLSVSHLAKSQLPDRVATSGGKEHCRPATWVKAQ
jgi:uncharacterized LabA/DUF88 family protein